MKKGCKSLNRFFVKNKEGQAKILTTVLIIAIVIVAVALVYNIVNPLISEKSGDILSSAQRIKLMNALSSNYVDNGDGTIDVTVTRDSTPGEISGIKYIVSTNETICYIEQPNILQPLETKTFVVDVSNCEGVVENVNVEPILGEAGEVMIPTISLVSHWKFEGNAEDSVGDNHGSLINGSSIIYDSEKGNVLSLDGINDYVEIPDDDSLDIGTEDVTISSWIKTDSHGMIVSKGMEDRSVGDSLYYLFVSDYWRTFMSDLRCSSAGMGISDITTPLNDSNWHNLVMTMKRSSNTFNLYVDGELKKSRTMDFIFDNCNDMTDPYPLLIGRPGEERYPFPIAHFDGLIDDVMIYNRALSSFEISDIYNVQSQVGTEGVVELYSCQELNIPNQVYEISENFEIDRTINDKACLVVTVPSVTIDGKNILISKMWGGNFIYSNQFNTTIKNVNINMHDSSRRGKAIWLDETAKKAHVFNNKIDADYCIAIYSGSNTEILIENNELSNSEGWGWGIAQYLGSGYWTGNPPYSYNIIRDNYIHDLKFDGIYLHSSYNLVEGNRVENTNYGINVGGKDFTIKNNIFENNNIGIWFSGGYGNQNYPGPYVNYWINHKVIGNRVCGSIGGITYTKGVTADIYARGPNQVSEFTDNQCNSTYNTPECMSDCGPSIYRTVNGNLVSLSIENGDLSEFEILMIAEELPVGLSITDSSVTPAYSDNNIVVWLFESTLEVPSSILYSASGSASGVKGKWALKIEGIEGDIKNV